jgi:isocitrate dehydrogenase (NAD+)
MAVQHTCGTAGRLARLVGDMPTIAVLEGDQTGQELLEQSLRVLDPALLGVDLELRRFDLSLESRRATANQVVCDAADAMRECGLGLKAATITPEAAGDVGSPNAILRERVGGKVIVRTGRRIPGVPPVAGVNAPISVVRMAVDDAYGAKEWRETVGGDEVAYRTEKVTRSTCRAVAQFAFEQARRMRARVFGGPKYTVSPVYEGMLKEEMDAAAARHPDVQYEPQLIDATYALLLSRGSEQPLVIPTLNRDGDCMSDLVLQLFGSIAGAESILIGFEGEDMEPRVVMAEAPHGTAPALQGKNIANPMAMILATASLLSFMREPRARTASRAVYESVFEAVREGMRTADLGGHALSDEFTAAIVERVRGKLDVWESLGVE